MPSVLSTMFTISLVALIAGIVYLQFRRWRGRHIVSSVFLVLMALGLYFFVKAEVPGTQDLETKGVTEGTIGVVFSYIAMVLGMVAEYGYSRVERGPKRFRIDLELLMPIFASPIVFIPVLTISSDMTMGGAFTKSKLMVYLVAFQNGFFWKNFFEERRQIALASMPDSLQNLGNSAAAVRQPVLNKSKTHDQTASDNNDLERSDACVNDSGYDEPRKARAKSNRV
jgi:hypothetical protein